MIPFKYSNLKFEQIRLKSILGVTEGRLTYLDESQSTKDNEVFIRRAIPATVVRAFERNNGPVNRRGEVKKEKTMKVFMKPIIGAVVSYDGVAIAVERHRLGTLGDEQVEPGKRWISNTEINLEHAIKAVTSTGKWYIDGTYIYRLKESNPVFWSKVSADGHFRQLEADCIRISDLGRTDSGMRLFQENEVEVRTCLAFVAANGEYAVSPPLWRGLGAIGSRIDKAGVEEDIEEQHSGYADVERNHIDKIDEHLCVNLAFVLRAGRELTDQFGYDCIEPLNLPHLMLKLRTVNLPNVNVAIKQTYNTGVPFSRMAAWLLGLSRKVNGLEQYLVIRSLLRHLSGKGLYFTRGLSDTAVFLKGQSFDTVPLLTRDQALSGHGNLLDIGTIAMDDDPTDE